MMRLRCLLLIGCFAWPLMVVAAQVPARIDHGDLTALLYAQGRLLDA